MNKEQIIKTTVRELMEHGNLNIISKSFSEKYVAHAGNKKYSGHPFIKQWMKQIHSAIENIKIKKIEFFCQDDKTVTWQRTLTGKHTNNLLGIPPTQKTVTLVEMVVSRFEDEKIIEEWIVSELAGKLFSKHHNRK